jgi:hypothetical protein
MDNAMLTPLMLLHGFFPVELLVADVTLEGPIVAMRPLVDPEVSFLGVLFATDFAGEWFFSRMCDQMPLHGCHADKPFATNSTNRQNF